MFARRRAVNGRPLDGCGAGWVAPRQVALLIDSRRSRFGGLAQ